MNQTLLRERAFFASHQQTLAQLYEGKFVVIKGDVVLAAYDDAGWAAPKTKKRYGGSSYFVQKVARVPPAPTN